MVEFHVKPQNILSYRPGPTKRYTSYTGRPQPSGMTAIVSRS